MNYLPFSQGFMQNVFRGIGHAFSVPGMECNFSPTAELAGDDGDTADSALESLHRRPVSPVSYFITLCVSA